ncbi:MAG: hypothetical protein ACT4P5_01890, partial [Armatimonadota bacterium]
MMTAPLASIGITLMTGAWGFADGFFVVSWPGAFWSFTLAGVACLLLYAARRGPGRMTGALGDALAIAAAMVLLQLALPVLMAHLHRIPMASSLAVPIATVLGLRAGADAAGSLILDTREGAKVFALTWEMAALPSLLRLLLGAAISGGMAALPANALLIALAGAARASLLVLLIAGGARLSLVYEPAVTLLSLSPLALLLRTSPRRGPGRRGAGTTRRGGPIVATAALILSGACLGLAWGHRDTGSASEGRVLIDESRSDWEWTDQPFDHTRYGQRSVYNYGLWKSWIELHYPTRVTRFVPTQSDLRDTDVVIVKTPTAPYDADTIARLERFVRRGGGLYLIGDHTNLFGMSAVLNAVAAPYGIAFLHDDTFPLDHEAI